MKTNNENKKAVIFARVSTEAQDYTEQVNRMTVVSSWFVILLTSDCSSVTALSLSVVR